jgi:hypothetical protein
LETNIIIIIIIITDESEWCGVCVCVEGRGCDEGGADEREKNGRVVHGAENFDTILMIMHAIFTRWSEKRARMEEKCAGQAECAVLCVTLDAHAMHMCVLAHMGVGMNELTDFESFAR